MPMDRTATPWRTLDAPEVVTPGQASGNDGADGAPHAESPLDRWRPALVVIGLVASIGIGGLAFALTGGPTEGPALQGDPPFASPTGDPATALVVDVTGAVVRPGIYRMPFGSRVADAIKHAGGFGPRVDPTAAGRSLNLAAPLKDGDQVRVPSRDDAPTGGGAGTVGSGGTAAGPQAPVDLNAATEAQLDALPGVGPVTVGKIIAGRPFHSIDELVQRKIVGAATFEKLHGLIVVH
jgi:competence protein ComEA